ncbi:hypothetical protein N9N67_10500 [Bacteriovoracaceae bacterium]|nr:hypothetical protein [Bacteriovoracaceae bacterium]
MKLVLFFIALFNMSLYSQSYESNINDDYLNSGIVDYYINLGTNKLSWNRAETTLKLKLGDILRIHNKDLIDHQLHTNGKPCPHGARIKPGDFFDCVVTKTYNEKNDGPIYDHLYGRNARFYLQVD